MTLRHSRPARAQAGDEQRLLDRERREPGVVTLERADDARPRRGRPLLEQLAEHRRPEPVRLRGREAALERQLQRARSPSDSGSDSASV